jgi:hypothetical protein
VPAVRFFRGGKAPTLRRNQNIRSHTNRKSLSSCCGCCDKRSAPRLVPASVSVATYAGYISQTTSENRHEHQTALLTEDEHRFITAVRDNIGNVDTRLTNDPALLDKLTRAYGEARRLGHVMNIEFDGFKSSECRLQKAKARYDQFFDAQTGLPKKFFGIFGIPRIFNQARIQSSIVATNPPTQLTWYFMQPISHEYFSKAFAREKLPIESLLHP